MFILELENCGNYLSDIHIQPCFVGSIPDYVRADCIACMIMDVLVNLVLCPHSCLRESVSTLVIGKLTNFSGHYW